MSHSPLLSYAWREDAACTEVDPELWFPDRGRPAPEAVRICRTCPALAPCLADALAEPDRAWGVRAGVHERDREPLRAAYVAWRVAVAADHEALRAAARAASSADRRPLRALAAAVADEADALTGYVVALALSAPAAEVDAARDAYRAVKVARGWAEWDTDSCATPAYGSSATTDRARLHLLAVAHETALTTASDSAVPSSLAGAA